MRVILAAIAALSCVAAHAAGDAAAGKAQYAVCAACHGQQGEGLMALNAPKLSGQEEWYLIRQIEYYQDGIRGSHPRDIYGKQMAPMAMLLQTDKAVEDVVAYIRSLPDTPAAPTVTGDVERGRQLYATCAACHGIDGMGQEALNAPRQAGMSDWYMLKQLENFKLGIRGSDPRDIYGLQMVPMVQLLADDQAIRDVIAYINTLGRD